MKSINTILAITVSLLVLFGCSVTKGQKDTVSLPEGTTVETAEEIIKIIWGEAFINKISNKFPNFNPIANPSNQGISLKWFKFTPFDKEKKSTLSLHIEIKYKGGLDNADQIVQFAKSIVEEQVSEYFANKK